MYCGKAAKLAVGNVLPLGKCPDGTIVSMVEDKYADRGTLAKASGTSCIVVRFLNFHSMTSSFTRHERSFTHITRKRSS